MGSHSHAKTHTIASHNDTTGTGAELDELTDGSVTTLHSHAAAGATIATGSYTGDGTNGRQITIGFKCSLVFTFQLTDFSWCIMGQSWTAVQTSGIRNETSNSYLHATDGFVVHSGTYTTNPNRDGVTYYYWAISE